MKEGNGIGGFTRAAVREGPVPTSVRFYQGLGAIPDVTKSFAISTFLLLYYNQVLGLPATHVSIAMAIALFVDAVTDPMVGSYSDNFRSKLGRRHPFMYASILPLGITVYCLFSPPQFESQGALLAWLVFFVIATRVSMTFFAVPWNALFAEFSDDYRERSVIVTWRFLVAWISGISISVLAYTFIFPATEAYPLGQLNPASYQIFAVAAALVIMAGAFVTTHLTRSEIQYLRQPRGEEKRYRLSQGATEVWLALKNRDFRVLFLAVLASSVVIGTNQAFEIYMRTYFWELGPEQLRWLALSFTGGLLAFATAVPLQSIFDKKYVFVGCALLTMANGMVLVSLRFLGILPENGEPMLLVLIIASAVIAGYLGTTAIIMFVSMVADTLDSQELETGMRQEGVFNSSVGFSSKATLGVGVLIAGVLLDNVIQFPVGTAVADVPRDVIIRLGVVDGYVVPMFNLVALALAMRYGITRDRYQDIRRQLDEREAARRAADH
jgi:Na+/melibiose symporter-like transporter